MNREDLHYLWLTYPDGNNYYLPKAVHVWAVTTFNTLAREQDQQGMRQFFYLMAVAQEELQNQGLNGFEGLNGLFSIFKSKSRKQAESELPKLQAKLQEQARTITSQTQKISQLQNVVQQNQQVNAQLNQDIRVLNTQLQNAGGSKGGIKPVFVIIPSAIALVSTGLLVNEVVKKKKRKAA